MTHSNTLKFVGGFGFLSVARLINVVDTVQLEVTAPVVKVFPTREPPQVLLT